MGVAHLKLRLSQAHHNGVKIVPMCGYESVPFDLGALMVVSYMRDTLNR